MSLNLEKQLVFYGQYHHNVTNIAIHTLCVPLILLTFILLGTNTPPLLPLPPSLTIPYLPPNLGTLASLLYTTLYILMEPVAGSLLAPLLLGGTAATNYLTTTYGATANNYAIAVNAVSWIAQFVGHGKFEGRAPALLDNLVQAFFLAPFFVWMEVLFKLGYREELRKRLEGEVEREIENFRKGKENGNGEVKNGKAK